MTSTIKGQRMFASTTNCLVNVPDMTITARIGSKASIRCILDRRDMQDVDPKDQIVSLSVNGKQIIQKLKKVTLFDSIQQQMVTGLGFETTDDTSGLVSYQVMANKGVYGPARIFQVEEI